jgi:hypothetical protein
MLNALMEYSVFQYFVVCCVMYSCYRLYSLYYSISHENADFFGTLTDMSSEDEVFSYCLMLPDKSGQFTEFPSYSSIFDKKVYFEVDPSNHIELIELAAEVRRQNPFSGRRFSKLEWLQILLKHHSLDELRKEHEDKVEMFITQIIKWPERNYWSTQYNATLMELALNRNSLELHERVVFIASKLMTLASLQYQKEYIEEDLRTSTHFINTTTLEFLRVNEMIDGEKFNQLAARVAVPSNKDLS